LIVQLFDAKIDRQIIYYAMFPALVISYAVTAGFKSGAWQGAESLYTFDLFVFRIAIASFSAYVLGQIMDVFVFNKLRKHKSWWHAPFASAVFGNLIDTYIFFFVAFYKTSDAYLANNLLEIATVDYFFKVLVNSVFFLPMYKILLDWIIKRIERES